MSLGFCAPEILCPLQGITPVNRGPGKGDYEHEVLIWSRPRRRFGDFAAAGKVTRRPQAAKLPADRKKLSPTLYIIRKPPPVARRRTPKAAIFDKTPLA